MIDKNILRIVGEAIEVTADNGLHYGLITSVFLDNSSRRPVKCQALLSLGVISFDLSMCEAFYLDREEIVPIYASHEKSHTKLFWLEMFKGEE